MSLVKDLNLKYDGFEVAIPEWEISDQGVTALWGPSGSGKTSIFRALIGLEECPTLSWNFQGEDLARLAVGERRLGVVFQSHELFPHLTARENILFAAEARRVDLKKSAATLEKLASELSLNACLNRKVQLLSGGEAQRVALARAIAGEPRFLFLDEPFSSLDAELRSDARAVVMRVIAEFSIPTLLITHDADDVKALAHTTVRITNGRFV
jgi:ABC-type sulfate/molybdate transport systems ATPase subunit